MRSLALVLIGSLGVVPAFHTAVAQTFSSGSTGADGALDLRGHMSGTVVAFDPTRLNIDPERDNVFHFTMVNIPQGVTLELSEKWTPGPVYWLVSGEVVIGGDLSLAGRNGHPTGRPSSSRTPSIPGPGGFPGGIGAIGVDGNYPAAQFGFGPGGGSGARTPVNGFDWGYGGRSTVNAFLVPLVGGSGGGGGSYPHAGYSAGGGGAGGGAIMIASSTAIHLNGSGRLLAYGGYANTALWGCSHMGGGGGGGSIRLVAPAVHGSGQVHLYGGAGTNHTCDTRHRGTDGRIRIEAFTHNWTYTIYGNQSVGAPVATYVPSSKRTVRVVLIGSASVPASPRGEFEVPDVIITAGSEVMFQIEANGVPVGTTPEVHLFSQDAVEKVFPASPLVGSTASSTSSVPILVPAGYSRGFVRVKW